jgi:ketosteroid isomerase-like protein
MNPAVRFVEAMNRGDIYAVTAAFHPDFEMIVPQHPARGFKGRDQEVKNMQYLLTNYPNLRIEVERMVESGSEVWVENHLIATGLEMAAVVIFEIDAETDTIRGGRFYSEPVDREGPEIDEWMRNLGSGL